MMATERSSSRRVDEFLTLLPDDLLKKILLSIPVESLINLASTCKKWRDYLTDDDFARLHLDQWRSRYGILYSNNVNLVYSPIFDGKANKLKLARREDCFSRSLKEDDQVRVLDSCDGLFLIVYDYYNIDRKSRLVVCNPLMRSYKLLQLPPTRVCTCHWNMVYDASIKRYKTIGITREKCITKNGVRGRGFYVLELCRSSSESSEWKEVFVCDDKLGGGDFGGIVQKSVLVDEEGKKKKLYYLTYNDLTYKNDRFHDNEVRTSLIYIDIETHQVKAVEAAACSSMSILSMSILSCRFHVGSSSTGRFYISVSSSSQFNLFVLEDLHNPIWKRMLINNGRDDDQFFIEPLAVVQHNGDDEEEKKLSEINGKIDDYQTRSVYYSPDKFYIPYLHSLIMI